MKKLQARNSLIVTALSTLITVLAAWMLASPFDARRNIPDNLLARITGANGGKQEKGKVNCGDVNANTENDADPPPSPSYVASYKCGSPYGYYEGDPPVYVYTNQNHPCIWCPTVGQSISVGDVVEKNGYLPTDGTVNCGDGVPPAGAGLKGTCVNGSCINTVAYNCTTRLKFYVQQTQPRGGQ